MQQIEEQCTLGIHASIIIPPSWIIKLPKKVSRVACLCLCVCEREIVCILLHSYVYTVIKFVYGNMTLLVVHFSCIPVLCMSQFHDVSVSRRKGLRHINASGVLESHLVTLVLENVVSDCWRGFTRSFSVWNSEIHETNIKLFLVHVPLRWRHNFCSGRAIAENCLFYPRQLIFIICYVIFFSSDPFFKIILFSTILISPVILFSLPLHRVHSNPPCDPARNGKLH